MSHVDIHRNKNKWLGLAGQLIRNFPSRLKMTEHWFLLHNRCVGPDVFSQSSVFPLVVFLYILLGLTVMLVGVLVAAALLYWHWIEVVLLCRTFKNKDETLRGKITPGMPLSD